MALLIVVAWAGALIGGRSWAARREGGPDALAAAPVAALRAPEQRQLAGAARRASPDSPRATASQSPSEPSQPSESETRSHTEQTRRLLGQLLVRVHIGERLFPGNPEQAANHAQPYLMGWLDAVMLLAPDLAHEMSLELDAQLCDSRVSSGRQLTLLRVATEQPEFASERGLDCVIQRRASGDVEQDVVLWAALDAWRSGGLAPSAALSELEQGTSDGRTLRRIAAIRQRAAKPDLAPRQSPQRVAAEPAPAAPGP